ncbi:TPA: hypothetical protein OT511_001435 [Escherichia coli]|nr:hypothetical protein [Escherichia coli]
MGEKEILNFKHGEELRLGHFVKYKDYAALETKCAELAAENAALKQSEKEFNNFCRQEYYGWEDNFTETPATDAFLAEIERKAIRKFINSIEHILRDKLSPYDTEEMLEAMRIFLEEQGAKR